MLSLPSNVAWLALVIATYACKQQVVSVDPQVLSQQQLESLHCTLRTAHTTHFRRCKHTCSCIAQHSFYSCSFCATLNGEIRGHFQQFLYTVEFLQGKTPTYSCPSRHTRFIPRVYKRAFTTSRQIRPLQNDAPEGNMLTREVPPR
jgi:hypothetical protein